MARKRSGKKLPLGEVNGLDEDLEVEDDLDAEKGHPLENPLLVSQFIRMWPRAVFSTPAESEGSRGKPPAIGMMIKELQDPGVYVLYRNDVPFYVGQAKGKLCDRLRAHANGAGGLRTYFWNYFSAFVVENPSHIDEVEAILISAMPSVISNSSKPKLQRVRMGALTRKILRVLREKGVY